MPTSTTPTFAGVIPPVVTPLTADGELDRASFERVITSQLDAGVHGLFVLGSSGEVAYLDDARRTQVMEAAVEITAGRVPVMAGVIDLTTHRVADQVRRAVPASH